MDEDLYPWDQFPTPREDDNSDVDFDFGDDNTPCCECLFFESYLCDYCNQRKF